MWAEFAPAKINLTLELTGKRENGYHDIQSLIVFATCGDRILAEPSEKSGLNIIGPFAEGLKGDENSNLIMKALHQVEALCQKPMNMHITLEKNLPVASGIGGGSADAAAVLRVLRKILGGQVEAKDIEGIALALGADIPVCLDSHNAWVTGIGEIIQPMDVPALSLVLINPLKALPTRNVFAARQGAFAPPIKPPGNLDLKQLLTLTAKQGNMLEEAASSLMPEIKTMLKAIHETDNCLLARMSGSGATCFGLYETKQQADAAAASLHKTFPPYWTSAAQLIT